VKEQMQYSLQMHIPFPFFVHYLHRIKDDGYGNGVGSMKIGRQKENEMSKW